MYGAAARHRGSPSDSSDVHNDFGQPLAAITAVLAPEVGLAVAIASDQGDVLAPEFSGPIVLATPPPRRDAVDGGNARKIAKAARTTAAPTSDTDLLVQTSWCPCRRSVGRTDFSACCCALRLAWRASGIDGHRLIRRRGDYAAPPSLGP